MRASSLASLGALALASAGCGGSSSATHTTTRAATPHPPVAAAPGCDHFCLEAGPSGGPNPTGCKRPDGTLYDPKTPSGCLACPGQDCLDLVSHETTATNGAIAVRLRCRVSIPCDGALVVAQADSRNGGPDPLKLAPGQWVAASNFRVPANATADVLVKLTPVGQRLARSPNGYSGAVSIQIKAYGSVGYQPGGPPYPMLLIRS